MCILLLLTPVVLFSLLLQLSNPVLVTLCRWSVACCLKYSREFNSTGDYEVGRNTGSAPLCAQWSAELTLFGLAVYGSAVSVFCTSLAALAWSAKMRKLIIIDLFAFMLLAQKGLKECTYMDISHCYWMLACT